MKTLTLCAAGDIALMQALPAQYIGMDAVRDFLGGADVRVGNLEMVLSDFSCFASSYSGGTWLSGRPERLDELLEYGFDYLSFSNNHTMDYAYHGLYATLETLRAQNVATSGAGESLEEASAPAVLNTKNGTKVGVLSLTTTANDAARAGDGQGPIPPRPGLNMLRHYETFVVTPAHMQVLREIAQATCINGKADNLRKHGYMLETPGIYGFGSLQFAEGEQEARVTRPHPGDLARILRDVEKAQEWLDYVIVCAHSHEIKALTDDTPDWFIEELYRACIDAGAHAVIGSGTHQLKAVELYNGRPIFYSLGNFLFQIQKVEQLPADFYEKYGAPRTLSTEEVLAVRSQGGQRGLQTDILNYRSVIPRLEFESDKLAALALKPIELGFGDAHLLGLPHEASQKASQEIYGRLARLSAEYGTRMTLEGDGLIHISCT